MADIEVYGTEWCGDTQRSRRHLDQLGIGYRYVDLEADPRATAWVEAQNGGKRKMPTIKVGDQVLSVPGDAELDDALQAAGVR